MKSIQQSFFEEPENPIEEKLGKSFFDDLPKTPGVYIMYGNSGRVLYVGKSKNLRDRLFTYRRVNRSNSSRKIHKLVRMVHAIELKHCQSEKEALLQENKLIRRYKPEFNHAKKTPETYYYITLKVSEDQLYFLLAMQLPKNAKLHSHTFGCFKGHRTIRKGTGALLRQLYLLDRNISTVFDFPAVLTNKLTPLEYQTPLQTDVLAILKLPEFLAGKSLDFMENLIGKVSKRGLLENYIGRFILKDCEALKRLYDHCLKRDYELKKKLNLEERLIKQEKLDDYLIESAFI